MEVNALESLPFEILVEVFAHLPFEDLVNSAQYVNKTWHNAAQDSLLWKDLTFKPPIGMKCVEVMKLLAKAPLLSSFEFHEGLRIEVLLDVLFQCNKNITSLALGNARLRGEYCSKILENYPDLQSLQIPMSVFQENNIFGKFKNLKRIRCTLMDDLVSWHHEASGSGLKPDEWPALESIEIIADFCGGKMARLVAHTSHRLLNLEMQSSGDPQLLNSLKKCKKLESLKLNFLSRQCNNNLDLREVFSDIRSLVNLKSLSLRSFVHADMHVLQKAFQQAHYPQLTNVDLSHCLNFSPKVAGSIATACPQLEALSLQGCATLDDSCLQALAQCRYLHVLDISGCRMVTDSGLRQLQRCPQLRRLDLSWLGLVSRPMLEALAQLQALQVLRLDHTELDLSQLVSAAQRMPQLCSLSVYRATVDGESLQKELPRCWVVHSKHSVSTVIRDKAGNMEILQMNGVREGVVESIGQCHKLKVLKLNFLMRPFTSFPQLVQQLRGLVNLTSLSLNMLVCLEESELCALFEGAPFPQLCSLQLQHCMAVQLQVALALAQGLPQLLSLDLTGCLALESAGLEALLTLQSLEQLVLAGCRGLSTEALSALALARLPKLQELDVSGLGVLGPDALRVLLAAPALRSLTLDWSEQSCTALQQLQWVCAKRSPGSLVATFDKGCEPPAPVAS